MRTHAAAVALLAVVLLSGCAAAEPEAIATPSPTAAEEEPVEEAEYQLPTRAAMDDFTRSVAEAEYLAGVKESVPSVDYSDEVLINAGDATCDTMDRGDSMESVFMVLAGYLPDLPDLESVALIGGAASGTLCPEHVGYAE
ncbi:hypothetical protein GCM10027413_07330 [Conyzicola nivalis]|uniref:DUF732 domain-containing protein n=1 Tax=Conyzicola nivalis TaxID=1477021 RepID=A0A916SMH7_9MICO|nr:DUF732 domain-containing protein [Conyzicola nivalis]GGB04729.1 hypothetical protein GCM10010979_19300 [Conyzicola nivalis]